MIYDSLGFERFALSIIKKNQSQQQLQQHKISPYQTHPKVILNKNGTFEWQKELNSDVKCRCGHGRNNHIFGQLECLSTDPDARFSESICLCEEFTTRLPRPAVKTQAKIIQEKKKAKEIGSVRKLDQ